METSEDEHIEESQLNELAGARRLVGGGGVHYSTAKLRKSPAIEETQRMLVPNVKRLQNGKKGERASFFQRIHLLHKRIPQHVVSLDEKYLRRCLELIRISASEAAYCNLYMNSSPSKVEVSAYHLDPTVICKRKTFDSGRLLFEYPLSAGPGNVVISSSGPLIVDSVMGSENILQVLKSPLLRKLGALDEDNYIQSRLNGFKGSVSYSLNSSPGGFSNFSPENRVNEAPFRQNRKKGSQKMHRRLFSVSSTNSTTSDPSSSSATVCQGMLHVKWKEGLPHFIFSFDEHGEVYSAQSCPADSIDDCLYSFHLRKGNRKKHETCDAEKSQLVGKMKVSTSFSLCPDNSRIIERQFVLFACGVNSFMQTPRHNAKRNKTLPKKVLEAFRNSHSSRQRSISRFDGTSSNLDFCLWEPSQDAPDDLEPLDRPQPSGTDIEFPPNHELAAIVLKHHLPEEEPQQVGGWGMKFLKKVSLKQTSDDGEASPCCAHDSTGSLKTMNVVVPVGIHGGPKTRNGGPSSLIERWRSGGSCDCGGWDLGCPLTVLKTQPTKENASPQEAANGDCKLLELFIQGSEHISAGLRMVNVHDGLYFVQFQPRLSALQSFSAAVAYIHSQNPKLGNINGN